MAYIIRNVSTTQVIIDDLGITLSVGEDYDLKQEAQMDVALSADLIGSINNNNVIVLDPLDGITPLSKQESLAVVDTTNSPPYRIKGGTLDQLDDVTNNTPMDSQVLAYNATIQKWTPTNQSGGGGSNNGCFPFWLYDNTQKNITIVNNSLPFFLFDGTPSYIDLVSCN